MENRPTTKFELPITKQEVVIKEWLTGREYEVTQKPLLENYKKGIESVDLLGLNHRMVEAYTVSIGGKTEAILDTFLDLPSDDYQTILDKISELKKKV